MKITTHLYILKLIYMKQVSILSSHMERMGLISDSIKSYFTFNIELLYMMINQ